jgi:pimeloyl-ACP methyl ester carboxylesterase
LRKSSPVGAISAPRQKVSDARDVMNPQEWSMAEAFVSGSSVAAAEDSRQQWHLAYRRADVGQGISMAYRELGSGEPVVLIHGWPQHSQMWHSTAPRIGERYHVIAPDLRGSGGTTVKGPYDKAAMAGDVLRLMDLLQIGQARVAGYDLGAWCGL